ncbi:MAG: tetratricopeptide repeat protein [Chitinophagaceae bacterium]
MVKIAPLLILLFLFSGVFSQSAKIDSLRKLLKTETIDSNRVTLLWKLGEQYQFFKPDTTIQLAQQAQLLASRINFIEGESRSFAIMATGQYLLGNYTASLNNYMQKLKIEEKRNSIRNYASALNNIGVMYILLSDYKSALRYLYKADSIINAVGGVAKKDLQNGILTNLGETFYRMKKPDSAKHYFSEAFKIALKNKNDFSQAAAFVGLGNVYAGEENDSTALINYRQALGLLNDGTNNDLLCETALGFANVFQNNAQDDSVLHYAMLAFNVASRDGFLSREVDAANFLSKFYKSKKKFDSAYVYMEQAVILQDSLKGQAKTREAMIISSNEQIRQAEIVEQKLREKESRLQQLQILAICIFIPVFFIFTVAARKVKVNKNVVRFMGVVSLLLFFEFIILLLHPFIEELMHHNKVLELLVLVCIGAGLVPLHHRLEHIILEKLTKDKKVLAENNENSGENVLINSAGEININKDRIKEINQASVIEEKADNNKNSSPVHSATGDELRKSE